MTDLTPESDGDTIYANQMPWIVSICKNNHQFVRRIPTRSIMDWPENWKSYCPHCGTDKWKLDVNYDYVSTLLREKSLSPEAFKLLTHIQDAAKMAYNGDEAGALALIQDEAGPLLPFINNALKYGGWPAAIVLIFCMLTSCTPEIVGKIDIKYLTSWGSVHATLEKPPLQIGQARFERTSEPLPEARQTRQQRRQIERQTNKRLRQRGPRPALK